MNKEVLAELFGLYMAAMDYSFSNKSNFKRLEAFFRGKPWVNNRSDYGILMSRIHLSNRKHNPVMDRKSPLWHRAVGIWRNHMNDDYLVCHRLYEETILVYNTPEEETQQIELFN